MPAGKYKTIMNREDVLRTLTEHKEEIRSLGVKSLAIFGSVSRNEASGESDVDVLVEFEGPVGFFKFMEVKEHLESLLGREVDLVTRNALRRQLKPRILQEAVNAF